jgi:hypothetical protein
VRLGALRTRKQIAGEPYLLRRAVDDEEFLTRLRCLGREVGAIAEGDEVVRTGRLLARPRRLVGNKFRHETPSRPQLPRRQRKQQAHKRPDEYVPDQCVAFLAAWTGGR